jgi:hypothetical protein
LVPASSGDQETVRLDSAQITSAPGAGEAKTTVLPQSITHPELTRQLRRPKSKTVVLIVALVALAVVITFGYRHFAKEKQTALQSIAVMPFINASGNADVDYLSDGMTETLIGSLSQVPNLSVKSASAVFHYKGKETSAKTKS